MGSTTVSAAHYCTAMLVSLGTGHPQTRSRSGHVQVYGHGGNVRTRSRHDARLDSHDHQLRTRSAVQRSPYRSVLLCLSLLLGAPDCQ
jgi:hypothetical protein